ncbi:MAG: family transcriptional regulator, cyclic receptor protein [Nocardioidaceae bacterium]|jgi:CRP-like cAMP-binding protein|nr:family transcriptional regulator, cyclic receptor protein [Nocardioidaceae bacterium]
MDWPLLTPLSEAERAALLKASRHRAFVRGEVLFHEGDPGDSLYLVIRGHLAVRVSTPNGERATLNVVGPGSHVGELALTNRSGPHVRSATVVALEPAETRTLSAHAFYDLCDRHPRVQTLLVDLLATRVRQLSFRLLETMYLSLDRRLYRRLLFLCDVYADSQTPGVIPLTQEQLADLVGGTRPSVNQVLQKLVDEGIVSLGRGKLVVLDRDALAGKAAD